MLSGIEKFVFISKVVVYLYSETVKHYFVYEEKLVYIQCINDIFRY